MRTHYINSTYSLKAHFIYDIICFNQGVAWSPAGKVLKIIVVKPAVTPISVVNSVDITTVVHPYTDAHVFTRPREVEQVTDLAKLVERCT